jgi:hypothetical protein
VAVKPIELFKQKRESGAGRRVQGALRGESLRWAISGGPVRRRSGSSGRRTSSRCAWSG